MYNSKSNQRKEERDKNKKKKSTKIEIHETKRTRIIKKEINQRKNEKQSYLYECKTAIL